MSTVIQRSFAGGEIAPALYARVDISKYQTGLRMCRNFLVMRHGGLENRPGTKFIGQAKDSSTAVRLLPFTVSRSQTYILEMGKFYVRFIKNGSYITETAQSITDITQADPAVVTISSHGYSDGDDVVLSGIAGMTELNGRTVRVANSTTNTFEITDLNGDDIDSSGYTAYSSGGTAAKIYEVSTDYNSTHLFDIRYVQSADVMTFTHPYYPPRNLSRTSDTSWSFATVNTDPNVGSFGAIITVTGGAAGSKTFRYKVTDVVAETYEEGYSLSRGSISSVTDPTAANPINISFGTGAFENNIYKQVNGVYYFLGVSRNGSFDDIGQDVDTTKTVPIESTVFDVTGTSVSSITQASPGVVTASSHGLANGDPIIILGGDMTEARSNLYYAASVTTNTFELTDEDGNYIDTSGYTAYSSGGTVYRVGDWPTCVTYFQQRRVFANTLDESEKIWCSRTGKFTNFVRSQPLQDDDALEFEVAGTQVNPVNHLLDLNALIAFTESAEIAINGDDSGILRPGSINPKQQSYNGASSVRPIVVGRSAVYVQASGTAIRDLGYEFSSDGYQGNDLTIFSAHLFDEFTLLDGAYQQIPHSVVYYVRNDGTLLALTYVREQSIIAWSRHDFGSGLCKSVAVVPEGSEDAVYLLIERTINGNTVKYIERFSSRQFTDLLDAKFMDAHMTYDGRNTSSTTMTLSGGTDWDYLETLTLTASASYFASGDVGDEIHLTDSAGEVIRFEIKAYSSATVVTGKVNRTVPASLQGAAAASWSRAKKTIQGLDHLEGEQVSVFADGFVEASPNNDSYETVTVTGGSVTLSKAYSVIHIGLPYISDIETLDIDTLQGETLVDKEKRVSEITAYVEDTRGLWVGPKPPTSDTTDPLENLTEFKLRRNEGYDDPVELKTDVIDVIIKPEWNSNGRVFMRQVDPVPAAILSVAPAGALPFRR
jgi:hypothetical protein